MCTSILLPPNTGVGAKGFRYHLPSKAERTVNTMQFAEFMRNNWGWLLSFAGLMFTLVGYIYGQLVAVKRGLQALLRAQMINDYNHYSEKGYAPIYARQSFENCWVQYERLYKNGVMTDIHNKFMSLPVREG